MPLNPLEHSIFKYHQNEVALFSKALKTALHLLVSGRLFRRLINFFVNFSFTGIVLGDNRKTFFKPGWKTVDLYFADIISDLRNQQLPFTDSSVDAIYSSHLIEHLDHADELIKESYRCLKKGGVVRFVTPDLELLIRKYKEGDWRWFLRANGSFIFSRVIMGELPPESLSPHNLLVGWVASYSGRVDTGGGPLVSKDLVDSQLEKLSVYDFRNWCVSLLDKDRIHAHVHVYTQEELCQLLKDAGFSTVKCCSYRDSSNNAFKNIDRITHKNYSLYIEAQK